MICGTFYFKEQTAERIDFRKQRQCTDTDNALYNHHLKIQIENAFSFQTFNFTFSSNHRARERQMLFFF